MSERISAKPFGGGHTIQVKYLLWHFQQSGLKNIPPLFALTKIPMLPRRYACQFSHLLNVRAVLSVCSHINQMLFGTFGQGLVSGCNCSGILIRCPVRRFFAVLLRTTRHPIPPSPSAPLVQAMPRPQSNTVPTTPAGKTRYLARSKTSAIQQQL